MHHDSLYILRLLLIAVFAIATFPVAAASDAEEHMLVLVRHAEKQADGNDPCLTAAGRNRAKRLAHHLANLPVRQLFSTDYCRTRETLEVIAGERDLAIRFYEPEDSAILLETARQDAGVTVISAHSNTLPMLLQAMGFSSSEIGEDEYDHLFLVTFTGADPERLIHLKY